MRCTVWDTRTLKKPLFVAENLPSQNPETNLIFSPDEKFLLTGTAGAQAGVLAGAADEERAREAKASGKEGGKVVVLRRDGLEVVRSLSTSSPSPFARSKLMGIVVPCRYLVVFGCSRTLAFENQSSSFRRLDDAAFADSRLDRS